MKILKTKIMTIMIALILVTSTAFAIAPLPTANAHTPPWQIATTAYVTAQPDPVGLGQQISIVMLLNWVMPGALIQNDIRPHGYILTITKPDGNTEVTTYDPYDSGSSRFILYTPDQVGLYTVEFEYPGEVYDFPNRTDASSAYQNGAYQGDTFVGSTAATTFTVQETPIEFLPDTPLPTEYWSRPIFGMNIDWQSISSNWYGQYGIVAAQADRWQKEGAAPNSAHVMWTRPDRLGGLVGTLADPKAQFYLGFSYEDAFRNPLIMGGIVFYRASLNHAGFGGEYMALDLRTGERVWTNEDLNGPDAIQPVKGQFLDFQNADQHGVVGGLLWSTQGSTWRGYDVFTGELITTLTGVPSGTEVYTEKGDILRYVFNYNGRWMALWNNTAAMTNAPASSQSYGPDQQIRILGEVIDASKMTSSDPIAPGNSYTWNVTIPDLPGNSNPSIVGVIPGEMILGRSSSNTLTATPRIPTLPQTMWALSDNPATRGQLLWIKTYPAAPNNYTQMLAWYPIDPINKVFTMTYADTGERLGFSMLNGEQLWGPVGVPDSVIGGKGLQYYSSREGSAAYGNLYVSGYGGQVIAYSMLNGTTLWTWNSINSGVNSPWGLYPIHTGAYADGKVFVFSGEHSPNTPIYKGYRVYALNATDGTELWNLLDWSASGLGTSLANTAIADGYMIFLNGYDEQVYCIGKGPSATTVSIQNNVVPTGNTILIEGTVIDTAPGTKQHEQAARFPNGVPAVSDESMTGWMEYVYQQQPKPTNATGVPVSIDVIDSNGNYRHIGDTTSDASGSFHLAWAPDISGSYTVYASFAGSESYYVSYAQTALYATEPAPTAAPTAAPAQSVADMYFVPAIAGLFVAIIVVGLLIMFVLRKRP